MAISQICAGSPMPLPSRATPHCLPLIVAALQISVNSSVVQSLPSFAPAFSTSVLLTITDTAPANHGMPYRCTLPSDPLAE